MNSSITPIADLNVPPITLRQARIGVAGVGGFAQHHHAAIRQMELEGQARLIASCDPNIDHLADLVGELDFASRGVKLESNFEEMLANHGEGLDAVTLPVPIHLHASMHEACVRRGLACYLEKPPTLDPAELTQMIKIDTMADIPAFVGFHHLANPAMHQLKARIVSGEFGRLREVAFLGLAQRSKAYYARNSWAGRMTIGNNILLDSPCGNAMSHHLMNLLYLAGTEGEQDIAVPTAVKSLLMRANSTEGPDTIFASLELKNGVTGRLALSHACRNICKQREILVFDNATIIIDPRKQMFINSRKGPSLVTPFAIPPISLAINHFVNGLSSRKSWPPVQLKNCVSFVELNALLYIAATGIYPFDPSRIENGSNADAIFVNGLDAAAEKFVATGQWPGAGLALESPGLRYTPRTKLPHLRDAIAFLCSTRNDIELIP